MEKLTITEALSELKLINKKIVKKTELVKANLIRFDHVEDPLESKGGSRKVVESELQAIGDLEIRYTKIKTAINKANLETELTLNKVTMNIYSWLIWRRDQVSRITDLYRSLHRKIKDELDANANNPKAYKNSDGNPCFAKAIASLDYSELLGTHEKLIDVLERLDGQLSLKNATTSIEF